MRGPEVAKVSLRRIASNSDARVFSSAQIPSGRFANRGRPVAYASLRDFIARLETEGRLVRVAAPVSPALEMTEIQTRLLAEGGPAVIFENVVRADGSAYAMPVLANLFGTVERVAWGMGREPKDLRAVGEMLAVLRQPEPPGGLRDAWEQTSP